MKDAWLRLAVALITGLVLGAAAYALTFSGEVTRVSVRQQVQEEAIQRIDKRVEDLHRLFFESKYADQNRKR